jgi:uncharacterized protein (DUF2062 family)
MNKKTIFNKSVRFLKFLYLKMFRIHDTPQRVSLGFGLGVFTGILPGMGPIAALVLAAIFRVNKAAALLGSILTNTWLSVVTIVLSIKIGAAIMGLEWHEVLNTWHQLLRDFHWKQLLESSVLKMMLPVLAGYLILSLCLAFIVYITALSILVFLKRSKTPEI